MQLKRKENTKDNPTIYHTNKESFSFNRLFPIKFWNWDIYNTDCIFLARNCLKLRWINFTWRKVVISIYFYAMWSVWHTKTHRNESYSINFKSFRNCVSQLECCIYIFCLLNVTKFSLPHEMYIQFDFAH